MPAYFDTGFSVREVPWHGLGNILDDYPGSWDKARELAGLAWDPIEVAAYEVTNLYADGRADVQLIEDYKQIKRSDNGYRLDIANDTYELIPHDVMGEIFEAIMDAGEGDIRYETAGSLHGGKKVWALAKLGSERSIAGDPSPMQPYIALLNSHDGSAALRVIATNVRIVCANTWHAADVQATQRGSAYSFRHTKNWRDRVDEAKKALTASHAQIEHTMETARQLLEVQVKKVQRQTFIEQFAIHRTLANTVGRNKMSKVELEVRLSKPRVQRTLSNTMMQLHSVLESRTCDGIRDSLYGLVQAAGEFADHIRDKESDDTYFSRTMLTDSEPLKVAALRIARQVSKTG